MEGDLPEYRMEDLVIYFEARTSEYPDKQYVRGLKYIDKWRVLEQQEHVTQAEFDSFLGELEDIDSAGAGYRHLWMTVRTWGYGLGLRVPNEPPSRLTGYRDTATCIADSGFVGQITINKVYDVLSLDRQRSLVRLRNNQTKHRWYPLKQFQLSVPPPREYVQQERG